jgi:mono/diheme cytochrome c family protein
VRPLHAALAVVATCALLAATSVDEASSQQPTALDEAWSVGDCGRCHEVPGRDEVPRVDNCSTCHIWIRTVAGNPRARERAIEVFPHWERYERNTHSYLAVPRLEPAMARLEPSWVRAWLQDPHDIRPGMYEGMPRFALSPELLDALEQAFADALVEVPATPAPDPANVARGRSLFEERGCVACHAFGSSRPIPGTQTAPDLAHTRARMSPDRTVAWITNPLLISAKATMAPQPVTPDNAVALRDYLFLAEPGGAEPPPAPEPPKPTLEPVAWADVEERVFGRICVHCHMDPAQNEGRAGPGNAGGFGWAATGIELQTREGVATHIEAVVASMLRRRHEARRDHVAHGQVPAALERPELPGMPLGLPAISDEDIALVLGWVEQGMPE